MWTTLESPLESFNEFANCCSHAFNCSVEAIKQLDREQINDCANEFLNFIDHVDSLSDYELGQAVGYMVGKYGVDIFAGGVCAKTWKSYTNLRKANRACTFEAVASSNKSAQNLQTAATAHNSKVREYYRNVALEVDKQNKHVRGAHNFEPIKSVWTHDNLQGLLEKFAGKGRPNRRIAPGQPGYREVVDFETHIGYYKSKHSEKLVPTTRGEIHYSKKGAHIVPYRPKD